ncbi:MAG TPA: DUF1839 family protein [Baekduia sp.]
MSTAQAGVTPYVPHPVHQTGRTYVETNCYTDIVVELLHARGYEPLAMLGANVRMDFEGDQWTFFKPAPGDLERLYGIDIHEMQPYRPLPEQAVEQLAAGRTMIVELDSWWLPDTAATAYRSEHVKSSVAVDAIEPEREWMRYFHNAGRYELAGEDYRGVWASAVEHLPPYTELVRFDAGPALRDDALRDAARALLAGHLARRPATNPFVRFGAALDRDLPALLAGDPAGYHAYAFATVRMVGAGFELLGAHARWLLGDDGEDVAVATDDIVGASKLLSLKLARRKPFDPAPVIDGLAAEWERVVGGLDAALA